MRQNLPQVSRARSRTDGAFAHEEFSRVVREVASHEKQPPVHRDADAPKILNLAEAASLVRCSRAHLCNIINGKVRGIPHLPIVRIGRRVLFRRESLEQWLLQVEDAGPKRFAS
jgi:predicted DNA-binding transcriptional regulator AlpA